ncbi:hypothetical protein Y032_0077g1139 [Ancylostoma ceylanicum]|uniref:Uncharacterized protein n=1 Tax=Ancylostoma ceylanicum TaxID=53326 RepID=A0A016TUJ2_9BILA|nr:hypothetical protein Y032_0077g1139 [Ancylostoma ceylanicum]
MFDLLLIFVICSGMFWKLTSRAPHDFLLPVLRNTSAHPWPPLFLKKRAPSRVCHYADISRLEDAAGWSFTYTTTTETTTGHRVDSWILMSLDASLRLPTTNVLTLLMTLTEDLQLSEAVSREARTTMLDII